MANIPLAAGNLAGLELGGGLLPGIRDAWKRGR